MTEKQTATTTTTITFRRPEMKEKTYSLPPGLDEGLSKRDKQKISKVNSASENVTDDSVLSKLEKIALCRIQQDEASQRKMEEQEWNKNFSKYRSLIIISAVQIVILVLLIVVYRIFL